MRRNLGARGQVLQGKAANGRPALLAEHDRRAEPFHRVDQTRAQETRRHLAAALDHHRRQRQLRQRLQRRARDRRAPLRLVDLDHLHPGVSQTLV